MPATVGQIAQYLGGEVKGDKALILEGFVPADQPRAKYITFLVDIKQLPALEASDISCIVVPKDLQSSKKTLICHANPKLAFAKLLEFFFPAEKLTPSISDQAVISKTAKIGANCHIEPFVVIAENVQIGANAVIRANTTIDRDVVIGESIFIYPNVTIYPGTRIGDRVIIHSGTVIGSDGFGYVEDGEKRVKVPQVGNVILEDDVEIGANVTIDRSTMGSTIIHQGVKIDNLVHIAHNCEVGDHSVLCAQVGIAGTSKVGQSTILAGQVGISDHCEVGDQVIIGAQAGIPPKKKIPNQTQWAGTPARPWKEAIHSHAAMNRLPELAEEVKKLKDRIKKLEEMLAAEKSGAV